MSESTEIKQQLRQYILAASLPGKTPADLEDDTPLRTAGLLDSVATLNLVAFIERTFGIEIEAHEAGVENFDRLDDMTLFVERKRAAARSNA
jgi:acyl carrier protein